MTNSFTDRTRNEEKLNERPIATIAESELTLLLYAQGSQRNIWSFLKFWNSDISLKKNLSINIVL